MPSRQSTEVHEQPGEFSTGSYTNPAGTRPYKLYVPTRDAARPRSLVVMLHGCMQPADDFATGTRMNALAEEQHFLVLYPAQTQAASHARCWNWFTRTIHYDPTGRPALEHWLVHGGGHAWFGGSPNGSMTDPKGPDAAREMIRFFFQSGA
jgi:poly(3-hydroxybutyrate) depolymerase